MSRILILGATGNLGQLTADALASDPQVTLRVASSRRSGYDRLKARFPHAEVVIADWYDRESLVKAMQGVNRVFVATPDFYTDEHLVTPNIISAAQSVGDIEQIVRLIAIPDGLTADRLSPEFLATRCGANLHVIAKPLLVASGLPVTFLNVPAWIMFNLPWFLAPEVKKHRQLAMPAVTDASRMWVSEGDISEVAARLLRGSAEDHIGREYVLTAAQRYNYPQIAGILTEELGEQVTFVDEEGPLREMMGDKFDTLMTYFRHETQAYGEVTHHETVVDLLGRPQVTVQDYIRHHRHLFI